MKKIDLGEKPPQSQKISNPQKWYPIINYSDDGTDGVSTFSDEGIGKDITVKAVIKLVSINSRSDSPRCKLFDYAFEVRSIEMPEDLSKWGKK